MKVIKVNSLEEIKNKKTHWVTLFNSLKNKDIYLHPSWHISWLSSIGKGSNINFTFLYIKDELVGILPLIIYKGGIKEVFSNILAFSGNIQSDRHNVIIKSNFEKKCLKIFQNEVEMLLPKVDLIYFHSINSSSKFLDNLFLSSKKFFVLKNSLPNLKINNQSFNDIRLSWKSSHRGDINRQTRKLEQIGKLTFNRFSKDNLDSDLENYLRMHSKRWQVKYNYEYVNLKKFYKNLIIQFDNKIHFSNLKLGNKIISYHLGFIFDYKFYYYKPTYDINYHNYSPGKIHISKLIEFSISSKIKTFDFLLGDEFYKKNWINNIDFSNSYYIKGLSIYSNFSFWWFRFGKNFLKKIIIFFKKK